MAEAKPVSCQAPDCWNVAKHVCTNCARKVCGWHSAGSPVLPVGGSIVLVPVCMPECFAAWWTRPTPEAAV